jgi:indole-3-glycerol phosphate synthase
MAGLAGTGGPAMSTIFLEALLTAPIPVIAEVKLTDTTGTHLLGSRTVGELIEAYHDAGAPCMSVVTGSWFGGNSQLLAEVASRTDVPLLQKDFLTRACQLRHAKELGASAVLLTATLLPRPTLGRLIEQALHLGLTPFVEVCTEKDIAAVTHGPDCVVAVNNKNIRGRERDRGDLQRSLHLLPAVLRSGTRCPVSASGIPTPALAAHLVNSGYAALLVGTALLHASSPRAWFAEFDRHRTAPTPEIP